MIIATAAFLYRKGAEIIKILFCKPFYFETNICYPLIPNRWNRYRLVRIWHFFWNNTEDNWQRLPESSVYSRSDIYGTNRCMFFCRFWDWWSKPIPFLISLIILPLQKLLSLIWTKGVKMHTQNRPISKKFLLPLHLFEPGSEKMGVFWKEN